MALSNVALFGAAFLTPVLAGKITHTLGWDWTFYLVAIFTAAALPLTFFFVPETAFKRPDYLNADFEYANDRSASEVQLNDITTSEVTPGPDNQKQTSSAVEHRQPTSSQELPRKRESETPAKVSYLQTLKPFNGRKTDESFIKLLLRPFPLFFHPAILWVSHAAESLIKPQAYVLTIILGMLDPRRNHRMDRIHRCRPSRHLPRPTPMVQRGANRVPVHGGLHRFHTGSDPIGPSLRFDEPHHD